MKRRSLKRPKSGVVKIGRALNRVKCYVRVRPLSSTEVDREDELAVDVSENGKKITVNDSRIGLDKNYQFDQVFPPTTTNAEISNFICKPLVNAALNGFNGTVMAYGQTGSGKTHTLMSPDGIAATIIEKCFHKMTRNVNFQYKVSMSYLQIYQEKIYDLLNNSTPSKVDLTIREHPQKGIYVENLSEYVVRGPEEVRSLMQLGKKRLVFAETKMNRTSSRSHSVCILSIERSSAHFDKGKPTSSSIMKKKFDEKIHPTQVSEDVHSPKTSQQDEGSSDSENDDDVLSKMMAFNEDVVLKGHLYICDLAGSERIKKTNAEGERLSEAQYINFSLLELGNVIQALAESNETGRTGHIPFRNSTLTRLLQESFGGNCKTSLVVCCSPSELHAHETKCSLNFGSRAMKIRNTAYVNVEMDYKKLSDDLAKILDARDKEIEQLKVKQKHELDIIKKEATLAAEIKFSDELSEAKRAYASLQHLMDSQANVHAESMLKLQDDLSREKDSRLVLERKLKNEHDIVDVTKSRRTKCLLLNEVLSMQLFYALECTALGTNEMKNEASKHLITSDTAVETQDEILRNIDHHIGVLQTYLHVTERDLSKINGEEVYDEKWKLSFEMIEDSKDFQTRVVKIRDRLKMLKDNVDDRILKLLLRFIHSKESSSIEGMSQVYQALEQFLLSTKETSESKFFENPQDIESCLTYVLLDKALLCCLVVLKRNALEKKLNGLGKENEKITEELETTCRENKLLRKEIDSLRDQLNKNRPSGEHSIMSGENHPTIESLKVRNFNLQLEINGLRERIGNSHEEDWELVSLRERVMKLTKENQRLEFMMQTMTERFSNQNDFGKLETKEVETQVNILEDNAQIFTNPNASSNSDDAKEFVKVKAVTSIGQEELREKLLKSKLESDKTLKHLIEIKVDETLKTSEYDQRKFHKLDRMVDSAIDSAHIVNTNTGLILNTSKEDIESLERDIDAIKTSNEALEHECLALVKDRSTLESLLTDLRGNIAGLVEKVEKESSPKKQSFSKSITTDTDAEESLEKYTTRVYRTNWTTQPSFLTQFSPYRSERTRNININTDVIEFDSKTSQTDVSFLSESSNGSEESDEREEKHEDSMLLPWVSQKLAKKYSLIKQFVKHLEGEIRNFKIRTRVLETELKERQHLKDQNILLEDEVKELHGLKIYLESLLAEGIIDTDESKSLEHGDCNLRKWKHFENGSCSDLSDSSTLSKSTLNLSSTSAYSAKYQSMSRSMMDLTGSSMYSSLGSLPSSHSSFGSLKMLKLEIEGKPSRIRDKLKNASLLLQHTGSIESQLKASRQKCFRLEGELCKLVKEKKEMAEELDEARSRLRATECFQNIDAVKKDGNDKKNSLAKTEDCSFRTHRGKDENNRLKNELSLAKEQLVKLKAQLEISNTSHKHPDHSNHSEDDKRQERELVLTRERCLILAEELGASNKEKIKLGCDLQEALNNIDLLASEVRRLQNTDEECSKLEERVDELKIISRKTNDERLVDDTKLVELKSEVALLLEEKATLEESVSDLKWEKERLNEMDDIVKRLVQVEKDKQDYGKNTEGFENKKELMQLRQENELLRGKLRNVSKTLPKKDGTNTSRTQVFDTEIDENSYCGNKEVDTDSERGWYEPSKMRSRVSIREKTLTTEY